MRFRVWHGGNKGPPSGHPAEEYDVQEDGPVQLVDILKLTSAVHLCKHTHKWCVGAADVNGWLTLKAPELARPAFDIESTSNPLLSLVLQCEETGWVSAERVQDHRPGDEGDLKRQFLLKGQGARKEYFRCLLKIDSVWKGGVARISLNQPNVYYTCLMSVTPNCFILPDWEEKAYQRLLLKGPRSLEDEESDDAVVGGRLAEKNAKKRAKKARRVGSGTTAAKETIEISSSDSNSISSSSDEGAGGPPEDPPEEPPEEDVERGRATGELPTIMGQKVPSYPFCLLCLRTPRSIEASHRPAPPQPPTPTTHTDRWDVGDRCLAARCVRALSIEMSPLQQM